MKRLSALLICSALLLTGCAEDVKDVSSLPETEEATQTTSSQQTTAATSATTTAATSATATAATSATATAATTTASATTTDAKTTSAPVITGDIPEEDENALPEGYDYIVPTKGDLEATVVIDESTRLDLSALVEEVGYELDGIDLESDELYVRRREDNEAKYTGEELEEWRSRNYFYETTPTAYYCGSESEDWIAIIDYNYGTQISPYSRIVHVKNSEIVYTSEVLKASCIWWYSDDQLITPAGDKGLCIYDIASREARYIETADDGEKLHLHWYSLCSINNDYVIFDHYAKANEPHTYLYDRETGSVKEMRSFSFDTMADLWAIIGDKLYYYSEWTEEYSVYDLVTQEYALLDKDDFTALNRLENDDYIITSADKGFIYSGVVSAEAVVVTRKSDGEQKAFDLRELTNGNVIRSFYSDGNWLYFITPDDIIAINFNTAKIAQVNGGSDLSLEHGHFIRRVYEWTEDYSELISAHTTAGRLTTPQIVLHDYDGSAITPDSTVTIGSGANNNATDNIFDPTVYSVPFSVVCNGRVWLTDPSDNIVKLYHTGDTVSGLTVSDCRTVIDVMDSRSYFNGGYVTFDGSIEITGEAWLDTWGEFLSDKGDIFIELDDDCLFPAIDYSDYRANRSIHIPDGITYPEELTSLLPQDGSKVRVRAVVSEIRGEYLLYSRKSGGVGTWAKLTSLELLP